MKKILGIVSAVVISALAFAGCRFEPQYRVELEKQTVTDGIFPQVIERTVTGKKIRTCYQRGNCL